MVQFHFVARDLRSLWPDLARLDECDVARHAERFRGGVNNWIVQTYLRLRAPLAASRMHATIGETFLPGCINLAHRDSLNRALLPYHRSFIVGVRADRPPLHLCRWEVMQNDLEPEHGRKRYVPLWPQPGLVARDPSRGTTLQRIAYFGRTISAPAWFRDPAFHAALRAIGVNCCEALPVLAFAVPPNSEKTLVSAYTDRLMRNFAVRGDFRRDLAAATRPLTIICGADDELMLADKYAEAVRGAKVAVDVRVLDGINHMGIVAAPKAVAIVAEDVATRAMAGS